MDDQLNGRATAARSTRLRTGGRRLAVGLLVVLVASSCTLARNHQYQLDYVGWGYHFHVYQQPTAQIWVLHELVCKQNAACTLQLIKGQVDANRIPQWLSGTDRFFDDDGADLRGALRDVVPPSPSVNEPWRFGCLGGYRNIMWPGNDGDWYGVASGTAGCRLGVPARA